MYIQVHCNNGLSQVMLYCLSFDYLSILSTSVNGIVIIYTKTKAL